MVKSNETVCAQCEKIVAKSRCNNIAFIEQYGFKSLVCDPCAGYNDGLDND